VPQGRGDGRDGGECREPTMAKIVVIKKDGKTAGASFPIPKNLPSIKFGKSSEECDIRIQKIGVSQVHLVVQMNSDGALVASELSEVNETRLNDKMMKSGSVISHGDVFDICGRKFRYENLSSIPKKSPKRKLATPLRNAIHASNIAKTTKNDTKTGTPLTRKSSRRSVAFAAELSPEIFDKNLPPATPVTRGRQPASAAAAAMDSLDSPAEQVTRKSNRMKTPLRNEISSGVSLRKVKENVTPDEASPAPKPARRKGAVPTPARNAIKAGVQLRATKKQVQTPLRNEIKAGTSLRQVTRKGAVPTPARNAIKAGVQLRATKKKVQTPLRNEIKAGTSLRQVTRKGAVPTPVRQAIREGVTLKTTIRRMNMALKQAIEEGVDLSKLVKKGAVPTPARNAIRRGVQLKATKQKMQTPLRKQIAAGTKLSKVMKASAVATPVRNAIKAGVQLKATKQKMQTPLRAEIKRGKALNKVMKKGAVPTPARNAIKAGVQLKKVPTIEDMVPEPKPMAVLDIPKLDVKSMLVKELRAELQRLCLPTAGRKAELQKRLTTALYPAPANDVGPKMTKADLVSDRKLSLISEAIEMEEEPAAQTAAAEEALPDFTKMKVAELKAELTARDLSTKGLKKDLLARLIEATSTSSVQETTEPVPEPKMSRTKKGRQSLRRSRAAPEPTVDEEPVAAPAPRASRRSTKATVVEETAEAPTQSRQSSKRKAAAEEEEPEAPVSRSSRSKRATKTVKTTANDDTATARRSSRRSTRAGK